MRAHVRSLEWDGIVPLRQVLELTTPAYGGSSWPEALTWILGVASERAVIDELDAELAGRLAGDPDAVFDQPVRVEHYDPEEWDEDDQELLGDCPELPAIVNGMHRVAASELIGAPRVLVADGPLPDEGPDAEYVEVTFQVVGLPPGPDEDPDAFALGWLRSFRLTPHLWVEALPSVAGGEHLQMTWHCPHSLERALLASLEARTAARGGRFHRVRTRVVTGRQLDAEFDAIP